MLSLAIANKLNRDPVASPPIAPLPLRAGSQYENSFAESIMSGILLRSYHLKAQQPDMITGIRLDQQSGRTGRDPIPPQKPSPRCLACGVECMGRNALDACPWELWTMIEWSSN